MSADTGQTVSQRLQKVTDWAARLFYVRQYFLLERRAEAMRGFLKEGSATTHDMIKADFGTLNIKGLDIEPGAALPVRFLKKSEYSGEDKDDTSAGFVMFDTQHDGNIYIADDFYKEHLDARQRRFLPDLLSHEHTHRLQWHEQQAGWFGDDATVQPNLRFLNSEAWDNKDIKTSAYRLLRSFNRASTEFFLSPTGKLMGGIAKYYANEVEIQARMHEMLVRGYATWGKMPAAKMELWAALYNLGLEMPRSLRARMNASEEGRAALRDFRCSKYLHDSVAHSRHGIQCVYNFCMHGAERRRFWEAALPGIYGNLIELYGDREGRSRMGLGARPTAAKEMLRRIRLDEPGSIVKEIPALAAAVKPEHASLLINAMMAEFEKSERKDLILAGLDALLAREDMVTALNARGKVHSVGTPDYGHCIYRAVNTGSVEFVEKLCKVGVDPFTDFKILQNEGAPPIHETLVHLCGEYIYRRNRMERAADAQIFLKEKFTGLDDMTSEKSYLDGVEKALRALAASYPDLNTPQDVTRPGGQVVKITLGKVLEDCGIISPAAPGALGPLRKPYGI